MAQNAFKQALKAHHENCGTQPVGRATVLESLNNLCLTGADVLASKKVTTREYAQVMADIYRKAGELSVVPPYETNQLSLINSNAAIFEAMAQEQVATAPTATASIQTGRRKA